MPERSPDYDTKGASSKGDDIDIAPEVLERLLRVGSHGPLKHVEDIILPEPLSPLSPDTHVKQINSKRGPKLSEDWIEEVRKVWGNLNREEKLKESRLASLPAVQKLAISEYGGGTIGRSIALGVLMRKALLEAQKYDTNERVKALLTEYPDKSITEIASEFGLTREHFSRYYLPRAARFLTTAFQRILGQSG